jgi:hypothetical protein
MCELSPFHTGSILHALGDVFRYHQATPICYSKRNLPTYSSNFDLGFYRYAGILLPWSKSSFANILLRLVTPKESLLCGEKSMSLGSQCWSTAIGRLLAVSEPYDQLDIP